MIVPMNPYNHPAYPAHALLAEHPGSFNSSLRDGRHEEQGSQSESEDGAGYAYPDSHRIELEMEEDPNASLTVQTLNTDGTPKRPMNAFMIFARRRRPQVSAENQSMRTGEISKILSREWVAMDMSEKQFYLDQAKLLKENFNNKYPDYVYRRRPNNTRKKRRTDPGTSKPLEHPVAVDQLADEIPQADYGDTSPIDSEDQVMEGVPQDLRYSSLESDIHHGAEYDIQRGVVSSHSRSSSYHPPDNSYRQMGASDTRLSYVSPSHGRATPDMTVGQPAASASARLLDNVNHASQFPSYLHNIQSHHHPSLYSSETNSAHGLWEASTTTRGDQGRPPSWVSGSHDRSAVSMDDKSHLYSSVSPHPWSSNVSPAPVGTSNVSGPHTPNYAFPTLNSPFYPNQGHLQGNYNPSSPSPSNSAQPYATSAQMQSSSLGTRQSSGHGYEGRSFSPLPPINPSYSQSSSHGMQSYHHQQIRNPTAQMSLPTVQATSQATYRQSQPLDPSPQAGSGADLSSHVGYWSRDKMDNQ